MVNPARRLMFFKRPEFAELAKKKKNQVTKRENLPELEHRVTSTLASWGKNFLQLQLHCSPLRLRSWLLFKELSKSHSLDIMA